jgi:MFS family permease
MQTLVVPAIGVLARDLDASPTAATWVLTAFLLASAILAPLLSSLGDRYGKRRLLLVVLWVYLVGTVGRWRRGTWARWSGSAPSRASAWRCCPLGSGSSGRRWRPTGWRWALGWSPGCWVPARGSGWSPAA